MKTIGLIGGMSWESTATYYRTINERTAAIRGGLHSAPCVLWSFDFDEIERFQRDADWNSAAERMRDAAQRLERAGADFLMICTNTMHKLANAVQASAGIPLLHIADATAERIKTTGLSKVGLLGTRFTMEEDFYRGRLAERHGLDIAIPDADQRRIVHDVIYNELCHGQTNDAARRHYQEIIRSLAGRGCEGIILGCTEIGLLIQPEHSPVPLFDTAIIHAEAAVTWALRA